jgi:type IV secretory pathway VirB10-like protein
MQTPKRIPFRTRRGVPFSRDGKPAAGDQPPQSGDAEEQEGEGRAGTLITPARWEVPADRTRTLYPNMAIYAELEHDVSSDVPGEVRMVVVQEVQDAFFQGNILIPQYTHIFASQRGVPQYGQDALDVEVRLGQTPGGVMLDFTKSVAQDGRGQAGLRGKVDHHWVQVGVAAVLTALMSTATQQLVQNRGTFYPSFEEQAAANAARSLEQSGQAIVRRELQRPSTVTLKRGTPVMIQLKEAISLMTPPVVVDR